MRKASPCRFLLLSAFTLWGFALTNEAGEGYLRQKGPGPLRFGGPSSIDQIVHWAPPASQKVSKTLDQDCGNSLTNTLAPHSGEDSSDSNTNDPLGDGIVQLSSPGPSVPLAPNVDPASQFDPSLGMPFISPRILADLLAPKIGSTNSTAVLPTSLEGFWFLPPMPRLPLSSQAIYEVK